MYQIALIAFLYKAPNIDCYFARIMSNKRIRTKDFKNWCNSELSPLAWQRVTLKSATVLFEYEIEYDIINNPSDGDWLEGEVLTALFNSVREIYDVDVPVEVFSV